MTETGPETAPETPADEAATGTTATPAVPAAKPARTKRFSAPSGGGVSRANVDRVRSLVAKVVWILCVIFALSLAVMVLLIALKANKDNGLVKFDYKFSRHFDLHWFSLTNPVKDFDRHKGPATDVKTALFNYGIAAVVWLVIGRVLDSVIRPSGKATASR